MDDKYNVLKPKKPETKQEAIAQQIEELVKRRDKITNLAEKEAIQKEIRTLFAQWEREKLN
jgi:hypothetical protein